MCLSDVGANGTLWWPIDVSPYLVAPRSKAEVDARRGERTHGAGAVGGGRGVVGEAHSWNSTRFIRRSGSGWA